MVLTSTALQATTLLTQPGSTFLMPQRLMLAPLAGKYPVVVAVTEHEARGVIAIGLGAKPRAAIITWALRPGHPAHGYATMRVDDPSPAGLLRVLTLYTSPHPPKLTVLPGHASAIPITPHKPYSLSTIQAKVVHAARAHGLEPALVLGLVKEESGFNPTRVNPHSQAAGLMQLKPDTARDMGVVDALNPDDNLQGGTRYLALMFHLNSGDTRAALASYHSGRGDYMRRGESHADQEYIAKVLIAREAFLSANG